MWGLSEWKWPTVRSNSFFYCHDNWKTIIILSQHPNTLWLTSLKVLLQRSNIFCAVAVYAWLAPENKTSQALHDWLNLFKYHTGGFRGVSRPPPLSEFFWSTPVLKTYTKSSTILNSPLYKTLFETIKVACSKNSSLDRYLHFRRFWKK